MFILYYTPVYLPTQLHYYIQMPRQVAEDATCVLRSRLKVDLVTRDVLSCLLSLESFGWETTHLLPFLFSKNYMMQDACLVSPLKSQPFCICQLHVCYGSDPFLSKFNRKCNRRILRNPAFYARLVVAFRMMAEELKYLLSFLRKSPARIAVYCVPPASS